MFFIRVSRFCICCRIGCSGLGVLVRNFSFLPRGQGFGVMCSLLSIFVCCFGFISSLPVFSLPLYFVRMTSFLVSKKELAMKGVIGVVEVLH